MVRLGRGALPTFWTETVTLTASPLPSGREGGGSAETFTSSWASAHTPAAGTMPAPSELNSTYCDQGRPRLRSGTVAQTSSAPGCEATPSNLRLAAAGLAMPSALKGSSTSVSSARVWAVTSLWTVHVPPLKLSSVGVIPPEMRTT